MSERELKIHEVIAESQQLRTVVASVYVVLPRESVLDSIACRPRKVQRGALVARGGGVLSLRRNIRIKGRGRRRPRGRGPRTYGEAVEIEAALQRDKEATRIVKQSCKTS